MSARRSRARIRPATSDDVARIALYNARLAEESERRTLERATVEQGVANILAHPARGRYWIAELDGEPCGQCLVTEEWSDWSAGRYWWFQSVYVDADHRRRGVFRALWNHVLESAKEAGDVAAVRLYVEAGNEVARAAYEALGMQSTPYRVYEIETRAR